MLTPDFRIVRNGLFYDVVAVASGYAVTELVDTYGDARAWVEQHQADLDERRAEEARETAQAAADAKSRIRALDVIHAGVDAMRDGTPDRDWAVRMVLDLIGQHLADAGVEMAEAA